MAAISTAARNAACDAIVDLLDVGGAGTLEILDASDNVLVVLVLGATAFGAAGASVAGQADAAAIATVNATGAGIAAKYNAKDNAGTLVLNGTVGEAAAELIISNDGINIGDPISVTSWSVTMPAS